MAITEKIREWATDFKEKSFKDKAVLIIPYVLCIFFITRIAELYRLCGRNLYMFLKNIEYIYRVFPPHFMAIDLCIGIPIGFFIVWLVRWTNSIHKKNLRTGEEYGSARWGA